MSSFAAFAPVPRALVSQRSMAHPPMGTMPRFALEHPPPQLTTDAASPLSTTTTIDPTTQFVEPTSFDPVLNVPAFSVFCLVAVVFGALQWRISAIQAASEEQSIALDRLRDAKAQQLSGGGDRSSRGRRSRSRRSTTDDDDATTRRVQTALEAYRAAYDKVEGLRTVIPGVARIVAPPNALERVRDNEAAAQQFLGISSSTPSTNNNNEDKETTSELSLASKGVLVAVAVSQIALLVFLVFADPLAHPSTTTGLVDVMGAR